MKEGIAESVLKVAVPAACPEFCGYTVHHACGMLLLSSAAHVAPVMLHEVK